MCGIWRVFSSPESYCKPWNSITLGNEEYTDLHLFIAGVCGDVPPPLKTTSCVNGNLLYVFIRGAQLGRQVHRDICLRSSAVATIDISCNVCKFDYWEIITPAVPVEYSEINDNREEVWGGGCSLPRLGYIRLGLC
ncbi:hypothetical protein E2C01_099110 [Portunus trituberculatus]|uniref:Uncharacterized protein n=1 Tax=Portunus trituberculatus TaxID=210409 RepID=A0A5B7K8Q7_PORTR|nr:hypothetical protein [Portunus trituberculatus]